MKLNLGCGLEKKEGYINIDKCSRMNPDMILDLETGMNRIQSNSVDEIICDDFIEHIENYVLLFNEMWRVCKNGAKIKIKVPHALCDAAHDIDHKSYWVPRKLKQISESGDLYKYSGIKGKFEIDDLRVVKNSDEITFIFALMRVVK